MANPTDNLPAFAVPGLPSTLNPIPQVQPNLPKLAPAQPVVAQPAVVVPPSGFVPRGPTPYGVPGQAMPVAAMPVQPVDTTPSTPAAPTVAAGQPAAAGAPAAPVAQPGAVADNVVRPPIPAGGIDANGVPLPTGDPGATSNATAPAAATQTGTRIRAAIPTFGGASNNITAGAADDAGPEIIRGGMVSSPSSPVGGSGNIGPFIDPAGRISAGFDRQQAYAQNFMDQALKYIQGGGDIFERATRGRAIAGILHAVAGQNNEGSAQASGATGLNQSIAGVTSAGIGAGAQEYGADTSLQAAQEGNANRLALGTLDLQGRTAQTGQTQSIDPATGMYTTISNFAQPQVGQGGMVTLKPIVPPTRQAAAPKPIVGATYVDHAGNRAVYQQDGSYKAVK